MPAKKFSKNPRINILIENILDELCPFLEEQAAEISELTAIGKALGAGTDISALLEMILSIARRFTKADGGSLYLVNQETRQLEFHVVHNASLEIKKSGKEIDFPSVALYHSDQTPNLSNVSSYVFHTGEIVNIKDVYTTTRFQFDGTRIFDKALDYKSTSMIVIPMKNHQDDIIGILQLINAKDLASGRTIPFSLDAQEKAVALASQASVILTQQMLIVEMKQLFEAFIKAIAVSIDEKSKHTSGHIQRVTELCMMIAQKIHNDQDTFADQSLSPDQMDELRMAALMHDTGKITTPDHLIAKSSRLETVFDRIELLQTRWLLFKTQQKLDTAQQKLLLYQTGEPPDAIEKLDQTDARKTDQLEKEMAFLETINAHKTLLTKEQLNILEAIHRRKTSVLGQPIPCLTDDEFENLSIPSGTLTAAERDIVKSHAQVTEKILSKLPWPKKLSNITFIASTHHEKLDGSGYPLKLNGNELNIQARILAIADIFEALSAPDRPYKTPMPLSQTKKILKKMGAGGSLDKDIIQLFFQSDTHLDYARKHLAPSQIDT